MFSKELMYKSATPVKLDSRTNAWYKKIFYLFSITNFLIWYCNHNSFCIYLLNNFVI